MARSISRFGTDRTWLENNWVIYATLQKTRMLSDCGNKKRGSSSERNTSFIQLFHFSLFFSTEILILEKF